ncbi:TetR family transcriptional regulator ActII [Planotetraspora phitsanulokensis]|uniref:Transcriptional regulator n=1 Tax=Planotetraspora phitsanulokensis TaxID=575192 RepID=A0A8J3UB49_9ACTN|nr:TetR/AcrR family transcriptional regulator [Planotetraspora phitsanulokensis]GII40141.1 transcriptional regulator [Planotetraspora phitsanulokensis]
MSQQDDVPTAPWERPRKRQAPARIPLTRERIVEAAFVVLDRDGYDKLSMRQVAAELGVAVSALYVHVDDKDELLQLMYNRLFDDVELPEPDPETWQEQIKDFARDGRQRLLRHRDMARISMQHVPFTAELLPHVERLFGILRAGGLPDRVTAIAGDLLSTYMEGFTLEESMWQDRMKDSSWTVIGSRLENYFASLPPDRFPNLVALADLMVGETNDYRFELGLDIIVRGLASYGTHSDSDQDEAS